MTLVLGIITIPLLAGLGLLVKYRIKRWKQKQRRQQNDVWSIGLYEGPDPVTLAPAPGIRNPILTAKEVTDVPARFVADPFMIERDGAFHLFFELLNTKRKMGEIGHAVSDDLKTWRYSHVVLRERFHLSYPYVFEHDGEMYMIPECAKSKSIRLYKAASFPDDWRPIVTLLHGDKRKVPLLDPSIVFHDGHWYLFSYMRKVNNLHLHVAETLTGPWTEHPASPVFRNSDHFARPGGRVVRDGAVLYRFAQDGQPRYGSKAWGFRITELTPTTYREEAVSDTPVVQEGNEVWNGRGMHTVDPHRMPDGRWIALVDGLRNGNMAK
ncbi:hypothetical protein EST62_02395 [Chlorobaculum sp. 24CR]|uniref:glucosamine inositolphosphorylceramide transferase family protein n=1 Tax=Chlorobaculum sp. 24CR TaxID=2508878 RepID=UPI00100BD3D0|nr:hypothetical protein [Chlorobaculum sp. 24CR]RXK88721.1 hypothetical protein EST62_02395 [Chlorobaculum sp. 24CR]